MELYDIHKKEGLKRKLRGGLKLLFAMMIMSALIYAAGTLYVNASDDTDIDYINISTAEELMNMSPDGDYRLVADIDLSGMIWKPLVFTGHFDGNSFSILNASVKETGSFVRKTYDGNMKEYDTSFAGFFEVLEDGAEVKDLKLINLRIDVETDKPCFIGGIAGYMENSSIIRIAAPPATSSSIS